MTSTNSKELSQEYADVCEELGQLYKQLHALQGKADDLQKRKTELGKHLTDLARGNIAAYHVSNNRVVLVHYKDGPSVLDVK